MFRSLPLHLRQRRGGSLRVVAEDRAGARTSDLANDPGGPNERALLNVLAVPTSKAIRLYLPSRLSGNMCLSHGTSPIVFRSQALMASAA